MDLRKDVYFYDALASFPTYGSAECLYVDRSSGIIYTWDGSSYVASEPGPLPTGLTYLGSWNANTNSPTITSSVGSSGDYYIVGTAGTTNIDGISDWDIGDWIIFSSTGVWQKIDNSEIIQPTIYNSDSTLSGNRTVTMAGNTLNFSGGNVGIGTATPTEKLEVSGKTKTTTFQMTTTPTNGYVMTSDASGNGTWAAAAGGLTYFTEAQNTSAPNATVPVDSLTAVSAATNVDVAIVPKGTGALTLAIADNTAAGGNKRGANAIDLQTSRSSATQVASGTSSIAAGRLNIASGADSVAIGYSNTSYNPGSYVFGYSCTAGTYAHAIGNGSISSGTRGLTFGYQNTSSNDNALCLGGVNTASAPESVAVGNRNIANGAYSLAYGYYAHTFGIIGRKSYSSGIESTSGDAQYSKFVLRNRTTDATTTIVSTDSATVAATTNQVILSNQSAYRFKGTIIGKKSGSTNTSAWDVDGLIVRGANAASTTLVVGNVNVVSNVPAWGTPALTADTTNGGLKVEVTGALATNIQWTAVIETTEVIYA